MTEKSNSPFSLPKKSKERIPEIDFLRCFPIIIVCLYHLCWDVYYLQFFVGNYAVMMARYPGLDALNSWVTNSILGSDFIHTYLAPFVGGLFLFICGVSTTLSRNNFRRSLILIGASLAVSVGTEIISLIGDSSYFIGWGILHMMAFAIFIYSIIEALFRRKGKEVPALLVFVIAIITTFISIILLTGYCPFGNFHFQSWPTEKIKGDFISLHQTSPFALTLSALGYYKNVQDWWPIFPYFSVVFFGIGTGKLLYGKTRKSLCPKLCGKWMRPFCFIGRNTLWIYLFSQPVMIGILAIVALILGFRP